MIGMLQLRGCRGASLDRKGGSIVKIVEISNDNINEFFSYVGPDIADDMERRFYRGIGAKNEKEEVVGALIYELLPTDKLDENQSHIRFLKYDSKEAIEAIHQSYKEKAIYDHNIIETFYEIDNEEISDFLVAKGFSRDTKESDFVKVSLGELVDHPMLSSRELPAFITEIGSISVLQYRMAIRSFCLKGEHGILSDLLYLPMIWFDGDVSTCSVSEGKVDGLFLVRVMPSGTLMPVLLFAQGEDYTKKLLMMLVHAAKKAKDKYPPQTMVVVGGKSKEVRSIVSKLLPEKKGEKLFYGSRKE